MSLHEDECDQAISAGHQHLRGKVKQGETHLGSNVQTGFCWVVGSSVGARLAPHYSLPITNLCCWTHKNLVTQNPASLGYVQFGADWVVQLQHTFRSGQCCLCLWRVASSATVSSAGWSPDSRRFANATCGSSQMCIALTKVCLLCWTFSFDTGSEIRATHAVQGGQWTCLEGDVLLFSIGAGASLQQARLPLPVGKWLPQEHAQHTLHQCTRTSCTLRC